ncbi:radical SAM family protein [Plasticicumulans lactativorans]|uniref:Radical SAM family protein n=1 Tax=Plasticicumulans lactativorans TaxID=1133106 RepID=A0A4R2L8J7_9GAMM|nr:radical SAM protein [Plasticicumulans lactativorans]TCO80406.1 radical SAM family protein [Plasticicumulans lactativorans]
MNPAHPVVTPTGRRPAPPRRAGRTPERTRDGLPPMICFRVTRYCNARCGFCLAPPDGSHPPADTLGQRVDWLLAHGVRTVHFCGGEPSIHPALPQLLAQVQARGGRSRLTTNGIALSDALLSALRATRTPVKVSLHGDRAQHDAIVGRAAFDRTTANLHRLLAAGVPASVQTTVVAGAAWVVDWVAAFCLDAGVRRLSILPFIPRGSGYARRDEYGLAPAERRALREHVGTQRRALNGRLELRWLDFATRPLHVVEADGTLRLEGASEGEDVLLGHVPPPPARPAHA